MVVVTVTSFEEIHTPYILNPSLFQTQAISGCFHAPSTIRGLT